MPYLFALFGIGVFTAGVPSAADHQPTPKGDNQPITKPAEQPTSSAEEHLRQLRTCREGIIDSRARPEDRRRWTDLLLSYDTPQADELVVELLNLPDRPDLLRTLCAAITERGQVHPERLDASFVEPLIAVLGADNADLRSAAAAALAEYSGADVPARLGAIAAQTDVPLAKRLAAIDALAANTHRREVVGQLIRLLDLNVPEITTRAAAALDPLAPRPMGADREAWRGWWEQQSQMGEEAWLAEQLRVYRARERRLAAEFGAFRAETERDATAATSRLRDFQREVLRPLGPEQRDSRLVEWLDDPLPLVKMATLSIVKTRIADEGKRPEGDVLAALLRMLKSGPTALRREALQIVQNLNDPAVAEAVVARLGEEKDSATRVVVLQAVGKLGSAQAVPALVAEIADPSSRVDGVREAALALGQIAAKPEAKAVLQPAIEPLKKRFESTPPDQAVLRAALLSAMAGVADSSFAPEFLSAMESEDPGLLQPAVRGLTALGNTSKKPRFRSLTSHADPRVRLSAVEALGKLGREDADMEPLLARMNATLEPNELVRDAAWRAFRDTLAQRPVRERLRAAERLRDVPELETKYFSELIAQLYASGEDGVELDELRDRLSAILVTAGRHAEAVPYLRDFYEAAASRGQPEAATIGIRWLEAALYSPTHVGIGTLVTRLAESGPNDAMKAGIIDAIARYFESADANADADRTRRLVVELRSLSSDALGERWKARLAEWATRFDVPGDRGGKSPD